MTDPSGTRGAVRQVVDAVASIVPRDQEPLTTESIAALVDSGAARVLQPARYGGREFGADEFITMVGALAALDGSVGWLIAMSNAEAYHVAGLPEEVVDEVWSGDVNVLIAAGYRAGGRLVRSIGGHVLTGRWQAVAGAEYADWFLLTAEQNGDQWCTLVPRSAVGVEPSGNRTGLRAAGIGDVTASEVPIADRRISRIARERAESGPRLPTPVIVGAGAAAAVAGSAHGVWRTHVEQVRRRLAASYGGEELTDQTSSITQVARTASDIDAAQLQIATSVQPLATGAAAGRAQRQAVVRARDATDHLLASSQHALDASDPVTRFWRDVHAGCRLAIRLLDDLDPG